MLVLLVMSVAHPAAAAGNAAAEALFQQGRQLFKDGKIDEACVKFAESQRLEASTGTLLNLANCHAQQGKTATAWAEFSEALAEAQKDTDGLRVDYARQQIAELEPRLSRLTVTSTAEQELRVTVDGNPIVLDAALPYDPGVHTIQASAAGKQTYSTTLELGDDADQQMLSIPELESLDASTTAESAEVPQREPLEVGAEPTSWRNPTAYTLGTLGLASLGLGTYFALAAQSELSDAESDPGLCPGKVCSPSGRQQVNAAEVKANVATGALAGGGVAVGVALILLLTGGDDEPQQLASQPSTNMLPLIAPGQFGLAVARDF